MKATLIVLYNLKEGANKEAFEKWGKENDIPTVNSLESVSSYRMFNVNGLLGSPAKAPYQYAEITEVNDLEKLGADVSSDKMQKIVAEFSQFADNPIFLLTQEFA